jgi:DNA-binding response OmpR family regulator
MHQTAPLIQEEPRTSMVLLIARDPELEDTCRESLSEAGVTSIMSTRDPEEAAVLLSNRQLFDAVVIGVNRGDVEGRKLAQRMRRSHSDTPVVVLSPIANPRIRGFERFRTVATELRETIFRTVARRRSARAH